jgi:hypothetical protein
VYPYSVKLDLLTRVQGVRMRISDVPTTGFVTAYRNFEVKIMPRGLCGARSNGMDSVIRQPFLIGEDSLPAESFVAVYLIDV